MLPCPEASVSESTSAEERNPLRRSLYTVNNANQFICHTRKSDSSPQILIHLPEAEEGQVVFLYNRCGKKNISERICGIRIYVSEDGRSWHEIDIQLDDEQIYNRKSIPILSKYAPKHIMLRRDGQGDPIHISQVTIGNSLNQCYDLITQRNIASLNRFSSQYHLRVNEQGWIYDRVRKHGQPLHIKPIWSSELDLGRGIDSLCISDLNRFSNALIQIAHAVLFAHGIKACNVFVPECKRIRDIFPKGDRFTCQGLGVGIVIGNPNARDNCLEGRFLHVRAAQREFYANLPSTYEAIRSFSQATKLYDPAKILDAEEMVIHIRSGDIFRPQGKIHPDYGQPPLSFYRKAVEHAKPRIVHLVYQDMHNPVIKPLQQWLGEQSITFTKPLQSSLRKDVKTVLRAQTLVAGRGTFIPGAVSLGGNLKTLYCFHACLDLLGRRDVTYHVIKDRSSHYVDSIQQYNWRNSPEQRELMVSYPDAELELQSMALP
ncbi:hypothetical protein KBY96_15675 [Cyanobium sp. ATX 6A2]|uniref:hypothetical protein n=1 Tax=Cyanobium sp. ATX 6A2 TaxID=2823700 RepID=UPI0020CF6A46|nr:hypothetical protein [Cyanobium sp. ATX 6A2]MCP9889356.1 hypothetical protein [Cyanobium sp. ATX 6A2]